MTTPARIAHVLHNDGTGGGPVSVLRLSSYLAERYDVRVYHGAQGRVAAGCLERGVTHVRIPLETKALIPAGLLALCVNFRRWKPDLAILHGQWGGAVGALAARMAGVRRTIYIAHFPSFYTDWDLYRVVRNHLAERIPCRTARRVVALSKGNYYQYLIRRLVSADRLVHIPNAIDVSAVPPAEALEALRLRHRWHADQCHVVSVGRLADQKRVDWLLRSWRTVQERCPRARLWIVGSGPEERRLQALAGELGLGATCAFLGEQPRGIEYVAAADVVAMTSVYEGHANLPLEAMACGRPLVASEVDGVVDSFSDGNEGFLIPPGDVEGFAERLIQLIESPGLRAAVGARGREHSRVFDTSLMLPRYGALVREVLAGS
jgi:glycosyltransferase involved in cell wall biosynthesis